MPAKNPRPRKYANAAEKAAAYRERYAVLSIRLKPETAATLEGIAASRDIPRADLIADLISFALANRNWHTAPMYARSVVSKPQARRVKTKYTSIESTDPGVEE